jgi:hypothetical protein
LEEHTQLLSFKAMFANLPFTLLLLLLLLLLLIINHHLFKKGSFDVPLICSIPILTVLCPYIFIYLKLETPKPFSFEAQFTIYPRERAVIFFFFLL